MKWLVLLIAVAIVGFCIYYMYAEYRGGQLVTPEMRNSDEYKLAVEEAVADARRVRAIELAGGIAIFTIIGFTMAALKLRPAWLRTLLAAFTAWLVTFVVFAMHMETIFHNANDKVQGTSMPFAAYQTCVACAAVGVILAFLFYFVTERIHVWRVGR